MKIIILAGGKGMRLWPLSREGLPKQFLKIGGDVSLFRQTLERALLIAGKEEIFISTGQENLLSLKRELRGSGISEKNIILRTESQETGSAIFSCLKKIEKEGSSEQEIIAIFPSDHLISSHAQFVSDMLEASRVAREGLVVTFGIAPDSPQTHYGYIKAGKKESGYYRVDRFTEKPDKATAEIFLREGGYFWNSGMFIFPLGIMLSEFQAHASDIESSEKKASLSFDKAVIEKSDKLAVIQASFSWGDVGDWKVFHEISKKDGQGNYISGEVMHRNLSNSLVVGDKKLIVGVNLKDIVIVDSPDALLVVSRDDTFAVKKIVEEMQERQRGELKSKHPYFSICTVIFSEKDLKNVLEATMKSVFSQKYPNIEYVILNAGNEVWNENIVTAAKEYQSKTKIVHVMHVAGIKKKPEAMNACLAEVTGDIVGFLKPNDLLADEFAIQSIVSRMEEEKAEVCWGDLLWVEEKNPNRIIRFYQSSNYRPNLFQAGWHPPYSSFFAKRELYEKYGNFRTDFAYSSDYEIMLRFLEKYHAVSCYIPKVLVKLKRKGLGQLISIPRIVMSNIECYRAFKINDLKGDWVTIVAKPLMKTFQFFRKR